MECVRVFLRDDVGNIFTHAPQVRTRQSKLIRERMADVNTSLEAKKKHPEQEEKALPLSRALVVLSRERSQDRSHYPASRNIRGTSKWLQHSAKDPFQAPSVVWGARIHPSTPNTFELQNLLCSDADEGSSLLDVTDAPSHVLV